MTTPRIDLHTHSVLSDGTDTPTELVRKAAAAGLQVVALTDHDLVTGWAEAEEAGQRHGIRVVRGIEWSTTDGARGQHLLAYDVDPTHPEIAGMLQRAGRSRVWRYEQVLTRLAELDLGVEDAEVRTLVEDGGTPSRKHLAIALLARYPAEFPGGEQEVFARLLNPGARAYVDRDRPTIEDAVRATTAAGGTTVVAHPRDTTRDAGMSDERIEELAALGLTGIEVDHRMHSDADRAALRALAIRLDLVTTGSSDYHGTRKVDHDLGCHLTDPEQAARLIG